MKHHIKILFPAACALLLWTFSAAAAAAPVRAVFYPDGADVTEQMNLAVTDVNSRPALVFDLPVQADPATLELDLPKSIMLADAAWEKIPDIFRGKGKKLFDDLEKLKSDLNGLKSRKQGMAAQIGFWTGQAPFKSMSAAEATKLSEAIGKNVHSINADQFELDKQINVLGKKVAALENKLARAAGRERAMWRVTAFIAGSTRGTVSTGVSYLLRGAGWRPLCRFNALPEKNTIDFTYEAELHQNSGLDFTDADVALATLRRSSRSEPPHLRKWIIRPREDMVAFAESAPAPRAAKMMLAADANMAGGAEMDTAPPPVPEFQSGTTFGMWELGKRSIPAGEDIRLEITAETWKADFSWLLRPSMAKNSFLRSKVELMGNPDLPPAKGLFMINGKLLAARRIHLAGREHTLFFGSDPSVRAEEKLVDRKSGETGLLSSRQTFMWKYEITVENDKKRSVPVRVEEPRPVVRDERIELAVKADPEPKVDPKDDVWFWTFDIQPGKKHTFGYEVDVTAPDDMKLNPGR